MECRNNLGSTPLDRLSDISVLEGIQHQSAMYLPTPPKEMLDAAHPMFLPIGSETTVLPMKQMDIRLFPSHSLSGDGAVPRQKRKQLVIGCGCDAKEWCSS